MGWPVSHPGHKEWLHGLPYLCSAMPFPTLAFSGTPPGCGWTGRNSFYFIFWSTSVSLYFLKDLFLFFLIFFYIRVDLQCSGNPYIFFSRNVQKLKVKLKSTYNTTMQRGKKKSLIILIENISENFQHQQDFNRGQTINQESNHSWLQQKLVLDSIGHGGSDPPRTSPGGWHPLALALALGCLSSFILFKSEAISHLTVDDFQWTFSIDPGKGVRRRRHETILLRSFAEEKKVSLS